MTAISRVLGLHRPDPVELLSIAERARYVLGLRIVIVAAAVGLVLSHVAPVTVPITPVLLVTAAYLAVVGLAELLHRRSDAAQLVVVRGMLLLDGLVLAWAVAISGAATSPIRYLAFAHVLGVTVLFSYRSGLIVAMWHSLLLLLVAYAEPAGILGNGRSAAAVEVPAIATVVGLWLAALGAGAFAALSERALRAQKADLERLSTMLAQIQLAESPERIADILLTETVDAFSFRRGAVFASSAGELEAIAAVGVHVPVGTMLNDARAARNAIRERRVSAIARFDPDVDPGLGRIFEGARNLLVVPLLVERGRAVGVMVLERGGPARGIHRWIVAMVEQFASHGALALNNAWFAEERDARMREIEELRSLLEAHNAQLEDTVDERTAELRTAIEHLEDVDRQRRRLLDHVITAGEEERKRIAGDIHDDPVQKLVALKMRLELLSKQHPDLADVREGMTWVATAIQSLRHLLFDLRPPVLDEHGLAAAVRSFLENADVSFAWEVSDGLDRQPSAQTRLILYRIAQEVLTNARKHSEAQRVDVRLTEDDGEIAMEITDDGIGFEPRSGIAAEPGHMGLAAIRERAEMAGGRCQLHSLPREGTTFEVWLPMSDASDGSEGPPDPVALELVPGLGARTAGSAPADATSARVPGRRRAVAG
jgi:signal transduction histidine kinase